MKWKLLDVTKETDHPFLNFYTLHYELDKGGRKKDIRYFMASRHGKEEILPLSHTENTPDGVLIPLYYQDEKTGEISVLLTRQFRPALGTYVNSVPAGLVDQKDMDLLSTARREAMEEAGVKITDLEVLVSSGPTASGYSDETNAIVLGRIVSFEKRHLEPDEDIATRLVPLSEVKKELQDPTIFFALEVKMIMRYLLLRFEK